jgi:hypothetical protein
LNQKAINTEEKSSQWENYLSAAEEDDQGRPGSGHPPGEEGAEDGLGEGF